ncbi:MAG: Type I Iterative PKS [Chrysothrix sp. TS-e1954]|nr:MAG: Type I Iterative PKS [Chrysothrix sp. TS-e1954]
MITDATLTQAYAAIRSTVNHPDTPPAISVAMDGCVPAQSPSATSILLFGDQTADQYPLLKRLALRKETSILVAFFEHVAVALRAETQRLPKQRRIAIPDFLSVSDLLERYHSQQCKSEEIDSSLVTLAQLAHYIDELIPIGVEAVKIAFRIGHCVGSMASALSTFPKEPASWSTIVAGISEWTAQSALNDFHRRHDTPKSCHAYVSATSIQAVTISGPTSTTDRLFLESEILRQCHRVPLPIFAPYHASHLFGVIDVQSILDHSCRDSLKQFFPRMLLRSAATGKFLQCQDSLELMRAAIQEILMFPACWDTVLRETVTNLSSSENPHCSVTTLGISSLDSSLKSALEAGGILGLSDTTGNDRCPRSHLSSGRIQGQKIAIVGMAGRFPNAADHEGLWELLMRGLDVHKEIPKDRFDAQAHFDPSGKGKNKSHTPYGCFIDEPGLFDPRFFNMSPREAAQTDPMGRLALVTAYEALEMSGYVPNRTPSTKLHRIGTFYGQTSDDWREINAAENIDTYFITGGVRAFAPGRINYHFKFSGPSYSVDTACSSSLAAIQLACTSLWAGDCDTACAGGLNILTNPDIFSGLSKGQFLSPSGSCKTYDNDADGYCRGDGVGSVVLKRYSDAISDRDNILGCILGAATNHSAEAVSITHPHAGAQEYLYNKILTDAGVDAHEISYVEMHGTGTQAGDGIEMTSVTNVFAPRSRQRRANERLYLGAVKANIGHGEASSGVNSLVKVLMMMRENYIPPNVGIKGSVNKSFPKDLRGRNVHIPQHAVAWTRNGGEKRKIFLNNFSAAGGNTAILLEDAPIQPAAEVTDPRAYHVVMVSARAISSLNSNIEKLIDYIDMHPDASVSDLSYTVAARRIHHNYRIAFAATDMMNVRFSLKDSMRDSYSPVAMIAPTVVFAFTGQGSQYTGMAQQLYNDSSRFKAAIGSLDNIVTLQGLPSFMPLLLGADIATLSPVVVQLGMCCIQVALAQMWISWGVKPMAVIGHSLGEYAALEIAGVISVHDMIKLVGRRAELLVQYCNQFTHAMVAVRASEERVIDELGTDMVEIACKNGIQETVICGEIAKVERASTMLSSSGIRTTLLKLPYAFHSAQIDPILEPLRGLTRSISFSEPQIPILSTLTAEVVKHAGAVDSDYLVRHARKPVDFLGAMSEGRSSGVISDKSIWLEIGSHPICSGMIRSAFEEPITAIASLRKGEDVWKTITASLCTMYNKGVDIDFDEYHKEYNDAQRLLTLPSYSFNNKKYWLDYHQNWTLTKGEVPGPSSQAPPAIEAERKATTTSCQRLIIEDIHANTGTVVFQTDLSEPNLNDVVCGHLVNDNALCPSSLYADQALTAAGYLYRRLRPQADRTGMNVCKMEVLKPLVAKLPHPPEGQHIQIEATADLGAAEARLKYRSVTPEGKEIMLHAHCIVKYESLEEWHDGFDATSYLVKTQMDLLRQKSISGNAHKLLRGIAYKLFRSFVKYSTKFQGMEEVIVNSHDFEATATVDFRSSDDDGDFVFSPYWIDSLCHLSGFICNSTDLIDSERNISISHGWASMRFSRPLSPHKKYETYVRMLAKPNNVRSGDVYIFDEDELVGIVGGLKFQEISRRLMNIMLPPPKSTNTASITEMVASTGAPQAKANSTKPPPQSKKPAKVVKASRERRAASQRPTSSMVSRAMSIVAEETDVGLNELVDDAAFENLGVDSLLSLTVSARFREELEVDVPSTLFIDNRTVGTLKKYFAQFDGAVAVQSDSFSSPSEESVDRISDQDDTISTPPSSHPSEPDAKDDLELAPSNSDVSLARVIVTEEMGVAALDIAESADLTTIGMDSLMSLTILSTLRERTGIDLPSTFLVTNTTIEEIETALDMRRKPKPAAKPIPSTKTFPKSTSHLLDEVTTRLESRPIDVSELPKTSSVLLQGNPKTATRRLFFLPDGSGSATSYVSIPVIDSDIAVYALNCPFMKHPEDYTIGIEAVSGIYINEIKRRQPVGPYYIGGWSAGGVVAYEITAQLVSRGEKVDKLLLLDSPCPVALDPLPSRLHQFFDKIGLLGSKGAGSSPSWLLPHFDASIKALSAYEPAPLPFDRPVDTFAIWAREGVSGKPGDPRPPPAESEDPKPMKWLLDDRTDFGDNGWAQLLGNGNTRCGVMDGNHFTMMHEPHASKLCQLIREGLGLAA